MQNFKSRLCFVYLLVTGFCGSAPLSAYDSSKSQCEGYADNHDSYCYELPSHSDQLYPNQDWLPVPYKYACKSSREAQTADQAIRDFDNYCRDILLGNFQAESYPYQYPDINTGRFYCPSGDTLTYDSLDHTIQRFTQQSLDQANLGHIRVSVEVDYYSYQAQVTLNTDNADLAPVMEQFAKRHVAFLETAKQGLSGINKCKETPGCWQPHYNNENRITSHNSPWSFYLPLGLPMIGQKTVNFLNYPPFDALNNADYLKNFTMCRWTDVLKSVVGKDDYSLYRTILDAHPIAGPGSGAGGVMPSANRFFNDPENPDQYYVTPMLNLLATPVTGDRDTTLPVFVLGGRAQKTWKTITGQDIGDLPDAGLFSYEYEGRKVNTPWVASIHPDVTSYECCPGDDSPTCTRSFRGKQSVDLVKDEIIDLTAVCAVQALAENKYPGKAPREVLDQCREIWNSNAKKQEVCIRARLDYSFEGKGKCSSRRAAEAFCAANMNDACPAEFKSCDSYND